MAQNSQQRDQSRTVLASDRTTALANAVPPARQPMIEIPGYQVLEFLGQGGMATVYRAEQVSLERTVALKVMSADFNDDPTFTTRFLREARIAARLAHPAIITVHEVGVHQKLHYICMEYHGNGDLKDKLKIGLPQEEALFIARDILSALAFAHDAGFIHRDVKPANVLFRNDGGAVLMDFGIAKAADSDNKLTQAGSILGTPYYIAPELVSSRTPDGRTDLYSMGIMLYEMLTGAVPFSGNNAAAIMYAHVAKPMPRLDGDLAQFQELIDGLTAKEPDDRYQSAHEALRDLAPFVPGVRTGIAQTKSPTTGAVARRAAISDRPITKPTPAPQRDYEGDDDGLTLTVASASTQTAATGGEHDQQALSASPAASTNSSGTANNDGSLIAGDPDVSSDETRIASATVISRLTESAQARQGQKVAGGESLNATQPTQLAEHRVIRDRFKLMKTLGKGGMGSVYLAIDLLKQEAGDHDPQVALKLLNDKIGKAHNALRVMQRETKRSQELSHPNIIKVFDFDRDGDDLYMTMEILRGQPLDVAIQSGLIARMDLAEKCDVIAQMSAGLAYAHENNVIHCDFKPGNVFVCDDGKVKVLDFGIARIAAGVSDGSSGDTLYGYTPRYASHEIMQMLPAHPADDVYALACVAYEIITGKHPFDGRNIVDAERIQMVPERPKELKKHQWQALLRGLQFQKDARTPTADEFLKEFKGKLNWMLIGSAAAAVVLAVSVGAWYVGNVTANPEDQIPAEQRALAEQLAEQAVADLTRFHEKPKAFLYPKAMEAFKQALSANPYNQQALQALEGEASLLLAEQPSTLIEEQNLDEKIKHLLSIEAVPMRQELQARLQAD